MRNYNYNTRRLTSKEKTDLAYLALALVCGFILWILI